jgi:hypothetical protein
VKVEASHPDQRHARPFVASAPTKAPSRATLLIALRYAPALRKIAAQLGVDPSTVQAPLDLIGRRLSPRDVARLVRGGKPAGSLRRRRAQQQA